MRLSKKSIITTAIAVALAVAVVIGGGTFAYLRSNSEDIVNDFSANKVLVSLSESGDQQYEIIPGTEEVKDPKVTVDNTVDAYAYVEIIDNTNGLVTYEIAEGWTLLDGYENVWYREVAANAENKDFEVLKDNKVSYSAALTNEDMKDETGALKDGLDLTITAYAVQKNPFANAFDAFAAKDQVAVGNSEELVEALTDGKPVVLTENVEISSAQLQSVDNPSINLNNKTLEVTGNDVLSLSEGDSLVIENGDVSWETTNSSKVAVSMFENSALTIKDVNLNLSGSSIVVEPGVNVTSVEIIDSEIYSDDNYCISTNAADNTSGKSVNIDIKNSKLVANHSSDGDCTGVLFNVPGTLNIDNSEITAGRQAVIVRCGTANITNSTLTCTAAYTNYDQYTDSMWSSGNEVPVAVLVVGNRSNPTSYPFDATCTLENTDLIIPEDTGAIIYAAAYNGRTTTIIGGNFESITADSDDDSNIIIK